MDIYDEINIIDDFRQKFGLRESVRRACDLLVSYIGGLQKPLPGIAAQGFSIAVKCKECSALPDGSRDCTNADSRFTEATGGLL